MSPLRPCLSCGTPTSSTRCPDCSPPPRTRTDAHANRSWRWRKMSRRVRRDSPFCERCGRTDRLQVDHRVPLSRGGPEYDRSNLRVLCEVCHGEVWREQRGWGG